MSIHRCPDCVNMNDRTNCRTCMGSAYVHRRDSDGHITYPAQASEYLDWLLKGKRPGRRPSPQGYTR